MYHLIYVSSAVNLFSEDQLKQLLEVSRGNNSKVEVTGLLLYLDGNFIQVLEGEKEMVVTTHQRIAGDPRHRGLITLLQGDITKREFADWSMGFRNVDAATGKDAPGYNNFLDRKSTPDEKRSAALVLMEHFKNINR